MNRSSRQPISSRQWRAAGNDDPVRRDCLSHGFIDAVALRNLALVMDNNEYGKYLLRLLDEDIPFSLRESE
jgi:hypothetical protein